MKAICERCQHFLYAYPYLGFKYRICMDNSEAPDWTKALTESYMNERLNKTKKSCKRNKLVKVLHLDKN